MSLTPSPEDRSGEARYDFTDRPGKLFQSGHDRNRVPPRGVEINYDFVKGDDAATTPGAGKLFRHLAGPDRQGKNNELLEIRFRSPRE